MNTTAEISKSKQLLITFGVWVACVLASLLAVWGLSEVFGFQFSPSTVVVLSSTLVAVGCALHWKKNA
jgi:hypothetical protein